MPLLQSSVMEGGVFHYCVETAFFFFFFHAIDYNCHFQGDFLIIINKYLDWISEALSFSERNFICGPFNVGIIILIIDWLKLIYQIPFKHII